MKTEFFGTGCVPDRAAARRARIIGTARALFASNGFHATGVAQIARESDIAVGQLYRDFAGKEEIVLAIVAADCATFMARDVLRDALAARDETAILKWLRHFVKPEIDAEGDRLFAEIVAEGARNPRIASIFVQTSEDAIACLRQALALLAPGEAFADRRALLANLLLTQSLGIMQHRLLVPGLDTSQLADAVMFVIDREITQLRGRPLPG